MSPPILLFLARLGDVLLVVDINVLKKQVPTYRALFLTHCL